MPLAADVLTPYLRETAEVLRDTEPELWAFFRSARDTLLPDELRAQLLEQTYRLDPQDHPDLHELLIGVAEAVGVEAPVTLYQAQGLQLSDDNGNAQCLSFPDEVHVVFSGRLLETLSGPRLAAVLGHELTHHVIGQADGGALGVAERMLWSAAADGSAQPSHLESARRFQLHVETTADRGGLVACADLLAAVEALVSLTSGLSTVSGAAYLRQVAEVLDTPQRKASTASTHPEPYVRARALQLWSEHHDDVEREVEALLRGAPDLDRLDLRDQVRLTDLTRRLVAQAVGPRWMATDAVLGHAKLFGVTAPLATADPELLRACATAARVEQDDLAAVLLDLATCDPDLDDVALAQTQILADAAGLTDAYDALVAKELGLALRTVRSKRAAAAGLVAKASS